jgi:hypothetical protein
MTEEENKIEAQIEEYAANLPSVIDIDQLTVEFLRENYSHCDELPAISLSESSL